jgi:dTDP-4-dehydrorhamnose reductase
MKKILVTGSKGQLGQEIALISANYPGLEFFFHDVDTLDILDPSQIKQFFLKEKPDYVINCAAYTAVDKAETDREAAYAINSTGVINITDACMESGCRMFHISTDYVFDGTISTPLREDDTTHPVGVYAKSKFEGERYSLEHEGTIVIRTAWLYSTFGNNFVKTILRLGKERPEVSVVYDQVGSPTYAGDLAFAILTIISKVEEGTVEFEPGLFHFSNEGACSWYDFAKEIIANAALPCNIKPITTEQYPTPAKRPAYSVFSKDKIKKTYGITIPWWKDSLDGCVKKLCSN